MKTILKTSGSRRAATMLLMATIGIGLLSGPLKPYAVAAYQRVKGKKTVKERMQELHQVRTTWQTRLGKLGVGYPPQRVVMVGLKEERILELWAGDKRRRMTVLQRYPILGASGRLGPKTLEGDHQVPEGLYRVNGLNPNSMFHLSLRLNYPNAFDRKMAQADGRRYPGSDIFIHGGQASVGCLAMGDEAAEELFVLAADTGIRNVSVILSPWDMRSTQHRPVPPESPAWTPGLYDAIRVALMALKHGGG